MFEYGTIDIWIHMGLLFTGVGPTDYTSILYATDRAGKVLYDGQVAPLYREHRLDILKLPVERMDTAGYPVPILYCAIIAT